MPRNPAPPPTPPPTPNSGTDIDAVPGDPPVPITVWRTTAQAPTGSISARLVHRLIVAYSSPGEVVVDLTAGHALAEPAVRAGRRHHKAWLTAAGVVVIGPVTQPRHDRPVSAPRTSANIGRSTVTVWMSDDRTAADTGPATAEKDPATADMAPAADGHPLWGRAALVVAGWPLHRVESVSHARLVWLVSAAAALLSTDGCLVLAVTATTTDAAVPADFGPVVATAHEAGLGYLQHIVAVHCDIDGDQFTYYATPDETRDLTDGAAPPAHRRVHTDLLVFTPSGGHR